MSANTETTGADRAKCKAWCGRTDQRPGYGADTDGSWQPDFRYWDIADGQVPSELVGKPMWCSSDCRDARLPPIAAHAAHVERRKGPIYADWGCCGLRGACGRAIGDGGPGWRDYHDGKEPQLGMGDVFCPDHAPPEPAKLVFNDCSQFAKTGTHWFACLNAPKKSPPAQEAPKAAPMCCTKDKESTVCGGSLLKRVICHDVPPILMCDAHWILRESRLIEGAKAPYAGPERLPKPPAADWVEDCLPEAGR